MQTQSPIFDEIAKPMSEAAGAVDGVRREAETVARSQVQRLLSDMDLVAREEFEAARDMAIKALGGERAPQRRGLPRSEAKLGKTS